MSKKKMKLLSKTLILTATLFLTISCKKLPAKGTKNSVLIQYKNKSFKLARLSLSKGLFKTIKHKDPNSEKELNYSGFYFKELIPEFKKLLTLDSPSNIKVIAKDGYVMNLDWEEIKERNAFLALSVSGYGKDGIYNKSLNKYFDWRPGYLIFLKNSQKFKNSSPYQITKIVFKDFSEKELLLSKVSEKYKPGAKVFLRTCYKCHGFKESGGSKAPLVSYLTSRWHDDKELGKFLRDPQKTINKKIEMSAFKGSENELNSLVQFLRSIEIKN